MKSLLIKSHKISTPLEYPTANMLCFVSIFTAVILFLAFIVLIKLLEFFSSFNVRLPALRVFLVEDDEDDDDDDDDDEEDVIYITIEFDPDIPVGSISFAMYGEYI